MKQSIKMLLEQSNEKRRLWLYLISLDARQLRATTYPKALA